ncbi:MAG TPA: GNAT family N-acetyltransferase [Polyangia bacterium]|nr:GNAT family N-acetyltransferase [Polyangia bacterium]
MMRAFNLSEGIAWNEGAVAPAAVTLTNDAALGALAFIQNETEPIGYGLITWGYDLEWNGRDAFLTELYVAPAWRGRGVGARAMALLEDLVRAGGAAALHLMVRPENTPAVRLYASAGYVSPPRTFLTKVLRPPAP